MGYLPDLYMSMNATDAIFERAAEIDQFVEQEYRNSGLFPTSSVNALRSSEVLREIACLGLFSRFEGHLKRANPTARNPLVALEKSLVAAEFHEVASRLEILRRANNVIKHGEGQSAEWLAERESTLWFALAVVPEASEEIREDDTTDINAIVITNEDYYSEMKKIMVQALEVMPRLDPWRTF